MSTGKDWRGRDRLKRQKAQQAEDLRVQRDEQPREKRWRFLHIRSTKLARATQLGIDYPRKTDREVLDEQVIDDANGAKD